MANPNASQQAFEKAKTTFKKHLKDEKLFEDLLKITSIERVYEAIEHLQAKQDSERRIRRLHKISSFLNKLSAYASAVDTFVQVKPEIMALVWGPIQVLLVWTDNVTKFADAVVAAMEQISDALPHFVDITKIFGNNDMLRDKLALFYQDILEFYTVVFDFFNMSRPRIFFESVWPKQKAKIDVLVSHIERHTALMRNEVSFRHIQEEHEARVKALAHFDGQTSSQELQKFQALQSRVAPQAYNDRLDYLLNRLSEGSMKWLMRDKTLLEWLDMTSSAARYLWFHGIPGAGKFCKTYLSASTVKEARKHHQTLFAFPSHTSGSSTTAKSILQSLLFQLAFNAKDIQSALVGSDEWDLVSNANKVSEILKTMLKVGGPTYIIIDGLDEMEAFERGILLQKLLELDDCTETRVLVSSRPEDDIEKMLKTNAASITVNEENSASIQAYVNQRIRDWMGNTDFVQEAQEQIRHLLAPLAANANGMFLYARIVLDTAEGLTSLEEIERELRAPPKDLDEAYSRIFARINDLSPPLQRKAKMIYSWIGCAPIPMTQHEMEQALEIASGSNDAAPIVMASVNFVRICGVAVEVVDERPCFVHFTVSEYIVGRKLTDFMSKAEANYILAKSTLIYLCSGIFDQELSDKQLDENILAGRYRLHWFAFTQWIALTKSCIEESKDLSAYPDLRELLCRLVVDLSNSDFEGEVDLEDTILGDIESGWPDIVHMVCGVSQFRQDDSQADWDYTNRNEWVNKDPSTMSTMWARIYQRFRALVCDKIEHQKSICHCVMLKRHYGTRLFKCSFPSCSLSRQGFDTRKACDTHVKRENHGRPWKCTVPDCEFAVIGFSSRWDADSHWQTHHRISKPTSTHHVPQDEFSPDELQVLLFEFTKAGNVDGIQRLGPQIASHDEVVKPAVLLAARMGSLPMVEVLTEYPNFRDARFYPAVMKSDNPNLLLWFLKKLLDSERNGSIRAQYNWLAGEAVATSSPDMYAAWEDFFLDPERGLKAAYPYHSGSMLDYWGNKISFREMKKIPRRSVLFSSWALNAAKKNTLVFLGYTLVGLALSPKPSITLAAELLRLGAPIDFPNKMLTGMTALHYAVRGTSEQAAKFVRFLLEQGADPEYEYNRKKPANEPGARLLQKWVGETWDELVKRTEGARLEKKRQYEGTYEDTYRCLDEEEEEQNKTKRLRLAYILN
ncbi:hypothetical protein M406DRAFT_269589 [Cryphonectria parasitica EP155]|uniref:NACHT domain-containing protein n=1 Tax=Cryphonectria parasitica (strain ATCC 38755 / EP155) TaxID=660469 RepID=A0A9P4XSV3_CRYP1|nr:uncharacterized protein M406DRAFT_269589 [Cryphonectria parasitica EP155]KAF3760334.1 hypothetical protein M406DRAFT_269589 [Cryphonectria parasitica EP155]